VIIKKYSSFRASSTYYSYLYLHPGSLRPAHVLDNNPACHLPTNRYPWSCFCRCILPMKSQYYGCPQTSLKYCFWSCVSTITYTI